MNQTSDLDSLLESSINGLSKNFPELKKIGAFDIKNYYFDNLPTDIPNAFATGKDENHSVVVATSGILKMLNDDELEAVIGHEISHITHKDILISSIAATIATLISYIGNVILFSEFFGGMDERNNGSGIILLIAAILIPIGATVMDFSGFDGYKDRLINEIYSLDNENPILIFEHSSYNCYSHFLHWKRNPFF